jgi:hypothetical protein
MIIRGQALTLVLGTDWRDRVDVLGGEERVRVDGGNQRLMWSASADEWTTAIDISLSWLRRDGWHVHATSRGAEPRIKLSAAWRAAGAVAVKLKALAPGAMVELRRVNP